MASKKRIKNSSKPSSSKKEKKSFLNLDSDVKQGIWSILFFALAILSLLSFWGKAGAFGSLVKTVLVLLFGWGMYVAPFVFLVVAITLLFAWGTHTERSILFGAFLFFITLLGVFALTNFLFAVQRGGYLGFIVAWPLIHFVGTLGAVVILFALFCVSVVVSFHIRLGAIAAHIRDKRRLQKSSLQIAIDGKAQPQQEVLDLEVHTPETEQAKVDEAKKHGLGSRKKEDSQKDKEHLEKKSDAFIEAATLHFSHFELPSTKLLDEETGKPNSGDIVANANIIKRTFQNFGIDVEMSEVNVGPTVTQYTLKPAEGVKLARIKALENDLSLALAAHPLRMETPIPGRSLVGIEIPNKATSWVRLRAILESSPYKEMHGLILALGRDVRGSAIFVDLGKMPHLLVAGATGSGKTIALNAAILSLLFKHAPQTLRFILIDPKRVEFTVYADIPHLLAPIVVDNSKAVNALKWAVGEMERRFEVLAEAKARDISAYNSNKKINEHGEILPYIVIIIDELADLMASKGKEVEALIVRIAQMARAVGIHLVLATQRPSVEVITGLIKANITARMAFQVASQVDSRTVLDMSGSEKLLGRGDMLFLSPDKPKPIRVQGAYTSDDEVKRVAVHLREQKKKMEREHEEVAMEDFDHHTTFGATDSIDFDAMPNSEEGDELYEEAKMLVIRAQKASASYLQRRLRVGYARAARLLDLLEEKGVIGPGEGAKPRDVYLAPEDVGGQALLEADDNTYEDDEEDFT